MSRFPVVVAAIGVALIAAGAVLADNPSKEKIARTAAGNKLAKKEVLHLADLGKGGWSGGLVKPDLNSTLPCSYHPKQSDLVVVGAAQSDWDKSAAYQVSSEAQVLRTAAMVGRDWRRTVVAPQVLPCLRTAFKKALGSKGKVTSFSRVAFPHLTTYTRAFRFRGTLNSPNGKVPIESDFVVLGAGRNEISLTLIGFGAARASLRTDTLRLARVLEHRLQR